MTQITMNKNEFFDAIRVGLRKDDGKMEGVYRLSPFPGILEYLYLKTVTHDRVQVDPICFDQLKAFSISEDDAWNKAHIATTCERTVESLEEVLMRKTLALAKEEGMPEEEYQDLCSQMMTFGMTGETMIYLISNTEGVLGAATILDDFLIYELERKLQTEKLLVIPSSIHEFLVISADGRNTKNFTEIVQYVNQTELYPEERLSDTAYIVTSLEEGVTCC